jgi:manganese efflux pump family protein
VRRVAEVVSSWVVAAVLVAGCSGGAAASYRATTETCLSFALRAIQQRVTVTTEPAACAGLSPEQVNLAVTRAIREAVGPAPKALARHLADQDSVYLADLFSTVQPAPPAPPEAARPARSARSARSSTGVPLGLAALAAWLCTAAAGAYLIAGWRAGRGSRRPRRAGLVPVTVLSHFGLAVAGLGIWVAFLITGTAVLAWLGVGLIVLIAGLGMGALSAALPEPGRDPVSDRAGMPVAVIAVHGMLATATILLVLLATIGAG